MGHNEVPRLHRPQTRAARLSAIEEILRQYVITSQAQLRERLSDEGIDVTQATLSRDLDEIQAVKIRSANGAMAYAAMSDGVARNALLHHAAYGMPNSGDSTMTAHLQSIVDGRLQDSAAQTHHEKSYPSQDGHNSKSSEKSTAYAKGARGVDADRGEDTVTREINQHDDESNRMPHNHTQLRENLQGISGISARGVAEGNNVDTADTAGSSAEGDGIVVGNNSVVQSEYTQSVREHMDGDQLSQHSVVAHDESKLEQQLSRVLSGLIVSVAAANNLIVVHTPSGAAQYAASALDRQPLEGVLGTIAGDDTVLIIAIDNDAAQHRMQWLLSIANNAH